MKQNGSLNASEIERMRGAIQHYTASKDEQIGKKYKITTLILEDWLKAKASHPKVKETLESISSLEKQVLVNHQIQKFSFNLPASMSREKYI